MVSARALMLLCWSRDCWGRRSRLAEGSEDLTGNVALRAAHDLRLRPSFAGPPPHVVDCGLVQAHSCHYDPVQGGIGLAVAAPVQPLGGFGGPLRRERGRPAPLSKNAPFAHGPG